MIVSALSKMLRTDYIKEPLLLLPPRQCISIQCLNITSIYTTDWTEVTNYICYIILPVTLVLSLLAQFINIIVLTKQIRFSLDTYFLVLSVTILLHACTSIVILLPHYFDCILIKVTYYSILLHEWTQYIIIWIILSVALERTLTVTLYQTYNQVSPKQSWIISMLVIGVGCISTIPRCWQYDITVPSNLIIQRTGDHEEYNLVYFWYITCLFTGLPVILMLLTSIGLCSSTSHNHTVKYRAALILSRRLKEEIHLTKLIIRLMFLYMLLMLPLILLNCMYFLQVFDIDNPVSITLSNIFSLWYNIFFIVQQQLYFCYNKQYRLSFISLCCCLC